MEYSSLDLFSPEELELLVVGIPELDFDALEKNTKYEGGYDESTHVVRNFWKFVKEANPEDQSKLLKFVTSSTKAPIGGLGKMNFIIQKASTDSANLPTSHTCFNTLLLPDYGDDYDKLKCLLGRAILECEGFGLE
jgi:ubiquitin-protein ligase E3 A/E3 ubiquitin-protein ligase HERC4